MSSPALARHLSGLLQRSSPRETRSGRPCLVPEVPRIDPMPFSIPGSKNPSFRRACGPASERSCLSVRKSRLQGLATLLTASVLRPTEACFSFPRSWAFLFKAFIRIHGTAPVSQDTSARALSRQTERPDAGAPAAFSRGLSGSPSSPSLSGGDGDLAFLRFRTFQVFFRRTFEAVSSLFVPLSPFFFPTSEEAEKRGLRGYLPPARRFPSFEGR